MSTVPVHHTVTLSDKYHVTARLALHTILGTCFSVISYACRRCRMLHCLNTTLM